MRLALVAFLVLTIAAAGASCKRSRVENTANTNAAPASDDTVQTPPFSTREPERYQWTRVITAISAADGAATGAQQPVTQSVFMARDGDRRREDYEILPGVKLMVLRLPEGSYTLYPSKKIYAEIGSTGDASNARQGVPPDFSADKLVNASRVGARYEKLGTEDVLGRATTKYRVTTGGAQGAASVETIIWVDESLGMPIKSESTSRSQATGESKYTVEYRDIKLEADPSLFSLPKDYRKVGQQDIQKETLSNLPGLMGGDGEENKERGKKR